MHSASLSDSWWLHLSWRVSAAQEAELETDKQYTPHVKV